MRAAIFIDGKNFYTGWRDSARSIGIDFGKMASWLVEEVGADNMVGAHYYTGVETDENELADSKGKLQGFLKIVEQERGFHVHTFERRCRTTRCSSCKSTVPYTQEKEVDTSVVADMVFMACQNAFDIAILLSGDNDHAPAVRYLNRLGKQVFIASWAGTGVSKHLRVIAHDHIDLIGGLPSFVRGELSEDFSVVSTEPAVGSGPEAFLEELGNAERKFEGGYVGLNYFFTKWKSKILTDLPDQRRKILDGLIESGQVEVYSNDRDGQDALRTL